MTERVSTRDPADVDPANPEVSRGAWGAWRADGWLRKLRKWRALGGEVILHPKLVADLCELIVALSTEHDRQYLATYQLRMACARLRWACLALGALAVLSSLMTLALLLTRGLGVA